MPINCPHVYIIVSSSAVVIGDACRCDEEPMKVWFEPTSYIVDEDAGSVSITIRTNVTSGPSDGVVQFNTADGTATGIKYVYILYT